VTAPHMIDPARMLGQALSDASPDLMRTLLSTVINALLSVDADAVCGAEYGQVSPERVNSRNGYRHRELDTRVGTIDVAIPKLRTGSYFPEWLLERRKRAEAALISVVATCYLLGVSTRRMDKLVTSLGITSLSKSQVSRMAADLDEQVAAVMRLSSQGRSRENERGMQSGRTGSGHRGIRRFTAPAFDGAAELRRRMGFGLDAYRAGKVVGFELHGPAVLREGLRDSGALRHRPPRPHSPSAGTEERRQKGQIGPRPACQDRRFHVSMSDSGRADRDSPCRKGRNRDWRDARHRRGHCRNLRRTWRESCIDRPR